MIRQQQRKRGDAFRVDTMRSKVNRINKLKDEGQNCVGGCRDGKRTKVLHCFNLQNFKPDKVARYQRERTYRGRRTQKPATLRVSARWISLVVLRIMSRLLPENMIIVIINPSSPTFGHLQRSHCVHYTVTRFSY